MAMSISLLTGGETRKPRKRFPRGCFLLGLRCVAGLAVFLFLGIALLYLYSGGKNHWATSSLFVEEFAQDVFDLGINEAPVN